MLNTTVTPTSGRAFFGGKEVAKDPMGTRAVSSVVFQDAVVDYPLTGQQNLELHIRLWGTKGAEGHARLARLADVVGITEILGPSSGELQRGPAAADGDRPIPDSPSTQPRRVHLCSRGNPHCSVLLRRFAVSHHRPARWLNAAAKVLPLTLALALFRYGLTSHSGVTALHNIWVSTAPR